MLHYRTRLTLIMLGAEWLLFGGWYLTSVEGMRAIVRLRRDCVAIDQQVRQLHDEVTGVRRELNDWRADPFYVERYARNKLSMGYPGEQVLLV
ncbi:MAG: septum formation initiator family protein [Candidatus Dependentiae bacterium]|nr:septum formation initiator family protein [Candidatus Dependentiae bacterium]